MHFVYIISLPKLAFKNVNKQARDSSLLMMFGALNLHLLGCLRSVLGLKALLTYFVSQSEPKILRLVWNRYEVFLLIPIF